MAPVTMEGDRTRATLAQGLKFEMKQQTIEGLDLHVLVGTAADSVYDGGTDASVVDDGKIVAHVFAVKITRKHQTP